MNSTSEWHGLSQSLPSRKRLLLEHLCAVKRAKPKCVQSLNNSSEKRAPGNKLVNAAVLRFGPGDDTKVHACTTNLSSLASHSHSAQGSLKNPTKTTETKPKSIGLKVNEKVNVLKSSLDAIATRKKQARSELSGSTVGSCKNQALNQHSQDEIPEKLTVNADAQSTIVPFPSRIAAATIATV
eukprot:GHVT01096563.1.p2 GENE.GHVT01096563.1~~GHVT01096563.1.p2  ORF type:complete len:183 (-),score=8.28 GHVT01096563.1:506-1054(-)